MKPLCLSQPSFNWACLHLVDQPCLHVQDYLNKRREFRVGEHRWQFCHILPFPLSRDYEGPEDDNWATLAVYAQEESLLQQLQWGVRSLDIRIGYCEF